MHDSDTVITPQLQDLLRAVKGNISLNALLRNKKTECGDEGYGRMAQHMADRTIAPHNRYSADGIAAFNRHYAHELESMDYEQLASHISRQGRQTRHTMEGLAAFDELVSGVVEKNESRIKKALSSIRRISADRDEGDGYQFNIGDELRTGRAIMQGEIDARRDSNWMAKHRDIAVDPLLALVDGHDKGVSFTAALIAEANRVIEPKGYMPGSQGRPGEGSARY